MKLALITDTHQGVRNDHPDFLDASKKFYEKVYFPYLRDNNISCAIHLGDLVDRRKYVNILTAYRTRKEFIEPHEKLGVPLMVIQGNHDVYYRDTNEVSSITELYSNTPNVRIFSKPYELDCDGVRILLLPWICDENHEESMTWIKNTKAQICFGHLELDGFEMYQGQLASEGMDPAIFEKFDVVCSGHFHHKSSKGNIHYLGSHGEFTWSDYNDERGFHVFDTVTRELEFIRNPYYMFQKVLYNSDHVYADMIHGLERVEGKYVKVIVETNDNQSQFESFMERLESYNPLDVQVVDDHRNAGDIIDSLEDIDETDDTLTIIRKAIEESDFKTDLVTEFITELYQEAMSLE